jgi:hypothetical protein
VSHRGARFLASDALVGNAIYHTVGDRLTAVTQLGLDFDHAYAEIGQLIGVLPYEGSGERVKKHPDWFVWWNAAAAPLFSAWATFKREQVDSGDRTIGGDWIAYANRWKTDYPVYESWRKRLADLRASAQRMGMRLHTDEPAELPTSIVQDTLGDIAHLPKDATEAAKQAADDLWKVAKTALWIGVGLGALWGGAEIVKAARK